MTTAWAALLLAATLQPDDRLERARTKLSTLLSAARTEREEAVAARAEALDGHRKARELLALARSTALDDASKKEVEARIPRLVEDARCAAERAEAHVRGLDARLALTERALADLKRSAPEGPIDRLRRAVADRAARQVDAHVAEANGFLSDPVAEARLGGLMESLRRFAPFEGEAPRIRLVKGSFGSLAAFTTTDTVYVLESTLKGSPTDEDLLVLLGHELAHAQLRHYETFYLHRVKEDVLQRLQDPRSADPEVEETLRAHALDARSSAYAVEQELEAERLGAQMAVAAGASPRAILASLEEEAGLRALARARRPAGENALRHLIRDHPEPEQSLRMLRPLLAPDRK